MIMVPDGPISAVTPDSTGAGEPASSRGAEAEGAGAGGVAGAVAGPRAGTPADETGADGTGAWAPVTGAHEAIPSDPQATSFVPQPFM
jgi:hypothetical protein